MISPILSEYYDKYKNDLEIISISIDKDKIAWSKAIDADKMVWAQILDDDHPLPTRPKSITIADSYHLTTIPVLILIDKDSKIRGNFDGSKSSLDKLDIEIKKLMTDVAELY